MGSQCLDIVSLIDLIRKAFARVPRPAFTLSDAEVVDHYGDESVAFEEHDSHWWEIPDSIIERYNSLSHLDVDGKLYYLPAYMTWALRYFETSPSNSTDFTIYALTDTGNFIALGNVLTPEQRRAIIEFLRFAAYDPVACECFDSDNAKKGLDRRWLEGCALTSPRCQVSSSRAPASPPPPDDPPTREVVPAEQVCRLRQADQVQPLPMFRRDEIARLYD